MRAAFAFGIGLAVAVGSTVALAADDPRALVRAGIEAYERGLETEARSQRLGHFRRAANLFERAVEQGVRDSDLYTNLGNAALQAEQPGQAVLAYRRALELDPGHPGARRNLHYARSLLPDWVPRPEETGAMDSLFFWHRRLARADRARLGAAAFALAALAVALSLRTGQSGWRQAAIVPGLVWLVLLASVLLDPVRGARQQAVVTTPDSVARIADSPLAPSLFPTPLPSGVEVEIREQRADWVRVRLANGREAWLSASALTRVVDAG